MANVAQPISLLQPAGSGALKLAGVLAAAEAALQGKLSNYFFDDIITEGSGAGAPAGWITQHTAPGTSTITSGDKTGGIITMDGGATGAGNAVLYNQAAIVAPQSGPWYIETSIKLLTAVDAVAQMGVYLQDTGVGSKTLFLGYIGALNNANFIAQHSGARAGSAINLGVPVDATTYHTLAMWGDGSSAVSASIDRGTPISTTQSSLFTGLGQPLMFCTTNGTAASRKFNCDYFFCGWR